MSRSAWGSEPDEVEHLLGPLATQAARHVAQGRLELDVLAPGEQVVGLQRHVLHDVADAPPHLTRLAGDVETAHPRRARGGASSVVNMRMVVVLPAPLGPSNPKTSPASTWRSRCVDGPTGAERPRKALGFDHERHVDPSDVEAKRSPNQPSRVIQPYLRFRRRRREAAGRGHGARA